MIKTTIDAYSAFFLVALFLAFEMALQVSPSVMTGQLMQDLHIDAVGLGLMSGFYYYTYTFMQVPAGVLFDRFNVVSLVVGALAICVLGAVLFSLAQTMWLGVIARLCMGFGSAFAFVAVLIVAARSFPQRQFALLVGLAQLLAALGAMGGELPLGFSVERFGWRTTMLGFAVIGVVIAVLILLLSKRFQLANEQRVAVDKNPWQGLTSVLRNRQLLWTAGYALLSWAPMTAFASLWGVPFLKANYELSPEVAGIMCSLVWLGVGLGSPLAGWISDHTGKRMPCFMLLGILGVVTSSMILFADYMPVWSLALCLIMLGAASSGQALSFALVKDNTTVFNRATAIGFNNMAVVISGALFQPLIGALLKWHAGSSVVAQTDYLVGDYRFGLLLLPACHVLCFIFSIFLIKETHCVEVASVQVSRTT